MNGDGHGARPNFELERLAVADLRPHPRNYQEHPDDQIEHLVESIREHGVYRNIVVARDGTILAGHGVALAARKMGLEHIEAVRLDLDPDEPRALKVLAADNEISHLSIVDDRALTELLKEIKEFDVDGLLGTGYDEMMLANLVFVTRPEHEIADFDEAAEWVGMPEYDAGDRPFFLSVTCKTEEDRESLLQLMGIDGKHVKYRGKNNACVWWPPKQNDDRKSVRFEVWHGEKT